MKDCEFILSAPYLVTQNDAREIIENGSIAVDNGLIVDIGPRESVAANWSGRTNLDYADALIMPGLINAHTHSAMTFLRGLADDLPLMDWLNKAVFPVEARLNPEIVRLGSLLGCAEMLATGTTACVDMYIFEDAVFAAAKEAGIRCMGGEAVFSFPSAAAAGPEEALEITEDLAAKYADDPLISVAVNPHSVYTTESSVLRACADLALKRNLPLHIHLAETRRETALCLEKHGLRPVARAAENGIFEARVLAAHLVDINNDEVRFLAAKKAVPVHNPASNMKLASGVASVPMMLEAGLPVALGTDGPASNNTLNMFREMNRAALLGKVWSGDPAALPAGAVFDMASRSGAVAMNDPRLGSLETGKAADLAVIDTSGPHARPFYDAASLIVYALSGHECRLTMVDGKIRYRDGRFDFDYDGLLREAGRLKNFVLAKIS
ncbi:MAG: amidohydrolase [Desulfovibrio sp.]|nr:amidohydrolase [Desulfovibrio sp.]